MQALQKDKAGMIVTGNKGNKNDNDSCSLIGKKQHDIAYIFDLDGTLLDSMGLWEEVDTQFLKKRGIIVTPTDYKKAILAMDFKEAAAYTIARFGLRESADEIMREWREAAVFAYGHTVRLKPYAIEYLKSLRALGAAMAVATSLSADLYAPALHANGISGFFASVVSTSQTKNGKTHPDVYLLAAKTLGAEPSDCIVFEDILAAVRSAKKAGMTVYAMYDSASDSDWPQMVKEADGAFRDFRHVPLPARLTNSS